MFSKVITIYKKIKVWGFKSAFGEIPRRSRHLYYKFNLWLNYLRNKSVVPQFGFTIIAPITAGTSISKTTRDFLYALKDAGIPFQAYDIDGRRQIARQDYSEIITPAKDFCITKYQYAVEMFRSPLPASIPIKRLRIAFWEGLHGVKEAFPYLDTVCPIIAMSDFNYEGFKSELPRTPVYKIPYPLQRIPKDRPSREEYRSKLGLRPDDFVVFFNFDLGSYYRKNPIAVLHAFAIALRDKPNAKLIFKLNMTKTFPDKVALIKDEALRLGMSDKLIIIDGYLPGNEIYSLTDCCDTYISLHRAEGFGIGVAEAMQLGKAVVVTDYSSTTEFCNSENSIPIPYKLIPIKEGEYFTGMQTWADADVNAAAIALSELYNSPVKRKHLGDNAKTFVEDHFANNHFASAIKAMTE